MFGRREGNNDDVSDQMQVQFCTASNLHLYHLNPNRTCISASAQCQLLMSCTPACRYPMVQIALALIYFLASLL